MYTETFSYGSGNKRVSQLYFKCFFKHTVLCSSGLLVLLCYALASPLLSIEQHIITMSSERIGKWTLTPQREVHYINKEGKRSKGVNCFRMNGETRRRRICSSSSKHLFSKAKTPCFSNWVPIGTSLFCLLSFHT